ncbi:hypothetical protein PENARI_c016G10544 [Penicillium arizonense]|uniref:Uncharacterized protein n=1 Tax=Penicillium arizonense TaxID=1835702 RepID=A0A1F5LBP0_PENAI|nr:hypothetical protein PENARI_c016G10544 [Penicillium arizonense]
MASMSVDRDYCSLIKTL